MTVGLPARIVDAWTVAKDDHFQNLEMPLFHTSPHALIDAMSVEHFSVRKLQHGLTLAVEAKAAQVEVDGINNEEKARTLSHRERGSSLLFTTIPSSSGHVSVSAFKVAAKIRTGTLAIPSRVCLCGQHNTTLAHIISCKRMRGKFVRHDVLVDLIRNMCLKAGLVARTEWHCVAGSQKRMDVVIFMAQKTIWIDASIVNPLAPTYLTVKDPISYREKHKENKWQKLATERGHMFIPFVVNAFGGLGDSARSVLQLVAEEAYKRNPYQVPIDYRQFVEKHKSRAKQRVAHVLAHTLHLICPSRRLIREQSVRGQEGFTQVSGIQVQWQDTCKLGQRWCYSCIIIVK